MMMMTKASVVFLVLAFASCGCLAKEMAQVSFSVTARPTKGEQIELQSLLDPTVYWAHEGNVAGMDCEVRQRRLEFAMVVTDWNTT
jgi:hypothetical protein